MKLTIPDNVTGELYVKINGVEYADKTDAYLNDEEKQLSVYEKHVLERKLKQKGEAESASLAFTMGDNYTRNALLSPSNQYYYGKRDMLANLGYCTTQKELYIRFSVAGEYSYDDIAVISQPMNRYADQVAKLTEDPVEDITVDCNIVTAHTTLSKDKVLCIAIPYSKGWSAKVNGEPVEVLEGNGMYMALPLKAGYNEIELDYETPGIRSGIAVSLLTIGILILILAIPAWWETVQRIRRRRYDS